MASTGDRGLAGSGLEERIDVQTDANYNVTSLFEISDDPAPGLIVERMVYDPYGQASRLDADFDPLTGNPRQWQHLHQGGRLDETSGLHHFRHRDYDASLGRWTRQDPLGYIDGPNRYQFVMSNPTGWLDPLGLRRTREMLLATHEVARECESVLTAQECEEARRRAEFFQNTQPQPGGDGIFIDILNVLPGLDTVAAAQDAVIEGSEQVREVLDTIDAAAVNNLHPVLAGTVGGITGGARGLLPKDLGDAVSKVVPVGKGIQALRKLFGKAGGIIKKATGGGMQASVPTPPTPAGAVVPTPAAAERARNLGKGITESELGPSGKPKIHVVVHPTRKQAKDAARAEVGKGGTTVSHPSPQVGEPHFHGVNRDGIKDRIHHEYPK